MCINEADMNADIIVVYFMEVKRAAIRTDVALSRKRGDSYCVPQTRERHVITQCSIYIPLKADRERKTKIIYGRNFNSICM